MEGIMGEREKKAIIRGTDPFFGGGVAPVSRWKARGIVREFLKKRGVGLEEFRKLRKGHADKVLLAGELRRSTTMTMAWIARELNAGVPQTLWRALWAKGKKKR